MRVDHEGRAPGDLHYLPPYDPKDPLSIPPYLRIPAADRLAGWAKVGPAKSMPSFDTGPKKTQDPAVLEFLRQQEIDEKARTAARIAKMKAELAAKRVEPDHSAHTWDGFKGRWVWAITRNPVRYNADGSNRPDGPSKPPPGPKPGPTKEKSMPTKTKPTKAGKTTTVKPTKTKTPRGLTKNGKPETRGGKGPGVIAAIVEAINVPNGASVQEIVAALAKKFPERDTAAMTTTVRIQANLNSTNKDWVEGRGRVYYGGKVKAKAKAKSRKAK